MPDQEFPGFSLSKRWNVARLTPEISSSSKAGSLNGATFCQSVSATDAAVGAKDADRTSAGDPPVEAANDIPAIPSTDTDLLGRFSLEARFACDIEEFLLYSLRTNARRTCCIRSTFRPL
ncbi:MAG: hypothetical protein WA238_19195 [Methylocella sp.]